MSYIKNYDRWVGIILLIAVAFLFADTFNFKTRPFVPLNTTFWPRVILGLITVVALYLIIRGRASDDDPEPFSIKAGYVVIGSLAYVFTIPFGGFLLMSTIIGSIGFYWLTEVKTRRTIFHACAYGFLVSGFIYLIFKELLKVQLPFFGGF